MPAISMFFGILVRMYSEHNSLHQVPHLHAQFHIAKAIYALDERMLEGEFSKKKEKLLRAWLVIHEEELLADWLLFQQGERAFTIKPLS